MEKKLKYVHVGTGQRANMYLEALAGDYSDAGTICALCDTNQTRMDYWNNRLQKKFSIAPLPTYKAQDFDRMIAEIKPDKVIVTSMDRTHHKYIIRAMELGCDVITEKPMTTRDDLCRDILAAAEKLGAEVYMPPLSLCGDNAAMIGAQAYYEYLAGNTADMSLNAYATKSILGEAL